MTADRRRTQRRSKEVSGAAACPHWLWRSLLLWLPQPQLVEALSAKVCCMQHLRTTMLLCDCDRWPGCCSAQGRAGSRPRNRSLGEGAQGCVELVHYTLPEISPADVRPTSFLQYSCEARGALEGTPVPELAKRVVSCRSRSGSPVRSVASTGQTTPSSHPKLFTASIGTRLMEEPRSALLSQQIQHKSPRLPPARRGDDSQHSSAGRSHESHASLCVGPLFHSSHTSTGPAATRDSSPGFVSSKVQFSILST